jgi:hypothetical protein
MTWFFYNKEGKLLYDVVSSSVGDASSLGTIAPAGYVKIGDPPTVGTNTGVVRLAGGSLYQPSNTLTSATNPNLLDNTYRTVLVNSSAAATTVTLPAAPAVGQIYEVRDVGSTGAGFSATNNITINRNGNTIDGVAANLVLSQNGRGVVLVYDGFKWITLADRTITVVGAVDADTLDTLDSTQFLRSDVDDTAAGNITFGKSIYSPLDILNDTTNPNLLGDTHKTVIADPVTNSAPVTVTLPASPVVGQWYEITDANGGASTDNITIDPNGNNINTSAADIVLDTDFDSIVLVCTDATNWAIVAWRFPPSGPVATSLDDLTDVTITLPLEGQLLRYETTGTVWENTPLITVDDAGRLHLPEDTLTAGISLGDDAGPGNEVVVQWIADYTMSLNGRTVHVGTVNHTPTILENGVVPAGDTYDIAIPVDNTLLCNTAAGDLFIRLTDSLSAATFGGVPAFSGDVITVKDINGFAGTNVLALVAEGVRFRNVPILTLDSPVGVVDATTTTTPGGVGVDEVQNFMVTGVGTYNINFAGQITAGLTNTSTAIAVETAINNLSPHPNYGWFSVSVSGVNAGSGLSVVFNGGTSIDGQADYYMTLPWQSSKVIFDGINWYLI